MILLISGPNRVAMAHAIELGLPVGYLQTPRHFVSNTGQIPMAADNGCFSGFHEQRFVKMLGRLRGSSPLFVTSPDIVGNHHATLEMWEHWSVIIRDHELKPAFVLQNGCTESDWPDDCEALFIGGTTDYKLSSTVRNIVEKANEKGLWVHMGRVNSKKRIQYASDIGCHSVDGSGYARFPKYLIEGAMQCMTAPLQSPLLPCDP